MSKKNIPRSGKRCVWFPATVHHLAVPLARFFLRPAKRSKRPSTLTTTPIPWVPLFTSRAISKHTCLRGVDVAASAPRIEPSKWRKVLDTLRTKGHLKFLHSHGERFGGELMACAPWIKCPCAAGEKAYACSVPSRRYETTAGDSR